MQASRLFRFALCVALFHAPITTFAEPKEIPLWPSGAPGSQGKTAKEMTATNASGERTVWSVHNPSLTLYLPPKEKATGTALLVIPGGGHRNLAITHEGYNVGQWLSERGIAAFVLKHRLARESNSTYRIEVESFADAQRAMRLIRSRAGEWNVTPQRVGAIGFSAGGELVNMICARGNESRPDGGDAVDRQSSKPNSRRSFTPAAPAIFNRPGIHRRLSWPVPTRIAKTSRKGWRKFTCGSRKRGFQRSCISTQPAGMASACEHPIGGQSAPGRRGLRNGSRMAAFSSNLDARRRQSAAALF